MSAHLELASRIDRGSEAARMLGWIERAYPLLRSLTGAGVRETLELIDELLGPYLVLERCHVASGAPMLDWNAPREWVVREAWIKGPDGSTIVDVADHSLHLLGYSAPFRGRLSRAELDGHLYSLPEAPDLIPYRTSYWAKRWGFCLPHRTREALPDGEYEVLVDTSLLDGQEGGVMDWGELVLPGQEPGEILLSAHTCHPSLANDNLSAIAVAASFARLVAPLPRRYGLRILFAPATVGALAWLARHQDQPPEIVGGVVLANLGDRGRLHWKSTFAGDSAIDAAAAAVVGAAGGVIEDFSPFGYDERQYNSPGFRLPVGCLSRTPWGRYSEYHTSADNPAFLDGESLGGSLVALMEVVGRMEGGGSGFGVRDSATPGSDPALALAAGPASGSANSRFPIPDSRSSERYRNLAPFGEPQLGRRGLYRSLGGGADRDRELALLWVLCFSDGEHDLGAIAAISGLPVAVIERAADDLVAVDLLARV